MQILIDKQGKKFVGGSDAKKRADEIYHARKEIFSVGGKVVLREEANFQQVVRIFREMGIEVIMDEDFEKKRTEEGVHVFTAGTPREIELNFSESKAS